MKRLILLSLIMLTTSIIWGSSKYRVLYISSEPIKISNKTLSKGDIISDEDVIIWKDDSQIMKVLNLDTKKIHLLAAKCMKTSGFGSIKKYFILYKQLSSRAVSIIWSDNIDLAIAQKAVLNGPYKADNESYYYISYNYNNESINKKLPISGTDIILENKSIFVIDGRKIKPETIDAQLFFYNATKNERVSLSDSFAITPIDQKIINDYLTKMNATDLTKSEISEVIIDYILAYYHKCTMDKDDISSFVNKLLSSK